MITQHITHLMNPDVGPGLYRILASQCGIWSAAPTDNYTGLPAEKHSDFCWSILNLCFRLLIK